MKNEEIGLDSIQEEAILRRLKERKQAVKKEEGELFGREKELNLLEGYLENTSIFSNLVAVHGVRRVGKTKLVKHFIEKSVKETGGIVFNFIGDYEKTSFENIKMAENQVRIALKEVLGEDFILYEDFFYQNFKNSTYKKIDDWIYFFFYLEIMLSKLNKKEKIYMFFDEIAWYSSKGHEENFIKAFSNFWNGFCSGRDHMLVFVASSSKSWINSKIFKNTKGFFKRINGNIELNPFSFSEVVSMFKEKGWVKDKKEILKYYLIFGGFPKHYLDNKKQIRFELSFKQNQKQINDLYYYFKDEFLNMFKGIFSEKRHYAEMLKIICEKKRIKAEDMQLGLKKVIGKKFTLNYIKNELRRLKYEGLISSYGDGKDNNYYVNFYFIYFYFYWVKNNKKFNTESGDYYNWQGLIFEFFVFKNIDLVLENLALTNQEIYWNFFVKNKKGKIMAQIDILLEKKRRELKREFAILECKFFKSKSNINKEVIDELDCKKIVIEEFFTIYKKENEKLIKENKVNVNGVIITTETGENAYNILDWFN